MRHDLDGQTVGTTLPHAVLELESVTVANGSSPLIQGLNWRVSAGGITWVVGENGSGKSTLLRVLARRALPYSGSIRFLPPGGHTVWYHPSMAVPPEVHVGDWRRLVGRLGVSEYETPLQPELPQRRGVAGTSTGEQRRLLIDALLRRRATFYLFDEPFEHVSPAAKGTLNGLLRERASESVVIVATNQGRAAERVAGEGENVLRLLGGGEWIVEGAA